MGQGLSNPYISAALSDASRKAYSQDLMHFYKWGGVVPATPEMVADYLINYANNLAFFSLARKLISIGRAHTSLGFVSPIKNDLIKTTLKGIKRVHGVQQRRVEPFLKEDLIRSLNNVVGLRAQRDKALLLVGFAAGLRRSELSKLTMETIKFTHDGLLLNLLFSKTDQEGKGQVVAIPFAKGTICAVGALHEWLSLSGIIEGPVFRPINKHNQISDKSLSANAVAKVVKKFASIAGLDSSKFSGHSLRAGFVTSSAQAGIANWKIKQQTRHKSDAMLNVYIRTARIFIDNAAGELL